MSEDHDKRIAELEKQLAEQKKINRIAELEAQIASQKSGQQSERPKSDDSQAKRDEAEAAIQEWERKHGYLKEKKPKHGFLKEKKHGVSASRESVDFKTIQAQAEAQVQEWMQEASQELEQEHGHSNEKKSRGVRWLLVSLFQLVGVAGAFFVSFLLVDSCFGPKEIQTMDVEYCVESCMRSNATASVNDSRGACRSICEARKKRETEWINKP
jgi:hypothetical protein